MNFINTRHASEDLKKFMAGLSQAQVGKATSRAINRALSKGKSTLNREIRQTFNIGVSDVSKEMTTTNATPSKLVGLINANKKTTSLSRFNPTAVQWGRMGGGRVLTESKKAGGRKGSYATALSTDVFSKGRLGVTVEILKGSKKRLPSAFLLHHSSGNAAVMARGKYGSSKFNFGKQRLPISSLNTKSVFYQIKNDKVQTNSERIIIVEYRKRLVHELTRGVNYGRAKR